MKLIRFLSLAICCTFIGCGGGSSDSSDSITYMGGVWRGAFRLTRNECGLDLIQTYNFTHSVYQTDKSIELIDEENVRFTGSVVGDDGFSVDHPGPSSYQTPDGRTCDFTYRYRYDSVNDDGDRTAQARFIYSGVCTNGTTCETEYAGDAMRA